MKLPIEWLKDFVDISKLSPTDISNALFSIGFEVEEIIAAEDGEFVLDVSITANRPDCQSICGIAREIAAALGLDYIAPNFKYKTVPLGSDYMPSVKIKSDACSRYTGRLIKNVRICQSPEWMIKRLKLIGVRPINNIVDITNYVLFEMGQPLHAFDLRRIDSGIIVRDANSGEKITALDGNEYSLSPDMTVIADHSGALAIAGVMGGENSGIENDTTCIFLEAARFERSSVRRTSRKLGLRSDSSSRYEKGVDYQSVDDGRERALSLICSLGGGEIADAKSDCGIPRPQNKVITTSAKQISDLLGIKINENDIIKILTALDFIVNQNGKIIQCTVPLPREDVDNYADIAEEIIRYYGYDNIKSTYLKKANFTVGGLTDAMTRENGVKAVLCGKGLYEMMAYSFINPNFADLLRLEADDSRRNTLKILNPIGEDLSTMRTQLTHSMLSAIALNLSRSNENIKLFELGRTFLPTLPNELPNERKVLSIGLACEDADFYTLKSIVLAVLKYLGCCAKIAYSKEPFMHPGISADIFISNVKIGYFGQVHPEALENYKIGSKCFIAELDITDLLASKQNTKTYEEISRFPAVKRDLAVVTRENAPVGEMLWDIRNVSKDIIEEVRLFDIFRGNQVAEGCKSVAFSLKFRSVLKTLSEGEIQEIMDNIMNMLKSKYGASLR